MGLTAGLSGFAGCSLASVTCTTSVLSVLSVPSEARTVTRYSLFAAAFAGSELATSAGSS